jgi:hypothetical protein
MAHPLYIHYITYYIWDIIWRTALHSEVHGTSLALTDMLMWRVYSLADIIYTEFSAFQDNIEI